MNQRSRRLFPLLTVLVLLFAVRDSLLPVAEGLQTNDAYVLSFSGEENCSDGSGPYIFSTPFSVMHSFAAPEEDPASWQSCTYSGRIFRLTNTGIQAPDRDASLWAYSADAAPGASGAAFYRRIDLEDSAYCPRDAAAGLRSVILNSFPYIRDTGAIQEAANMWLEANGMEPIQNLQTGEAVLAAQQAIWKIVHGDSYAVLAHYAGAEASDEALCGITGSETETERTASNVCQLYQYYLALPGTAPLADIISEASFEDAGYTVTGEENGTFTVTATVRISAGIGPEDSLTLTAQCAGQSQTLALTEAGVYQFTFRDLEERMEVKLTVSGTQKGGDVYLYEPMGGRTAGRPMAGFDDSVMAVYGELLLTPDRILNIYKTREQPSGRVPVAGITFRIYRVATLSQPEQGEVDPDQVPTEADLEKYAVPGFLAATLTTDAAGLASCNFTRSGLPDGVYLVQELPGEEAADISDPFFIAVPGISRDGTGKQYTLTVNPKSSAEPAPEINKDVTDLQNESDSFSVGEPHTWILRGSIPPGIGTAKSYRITDTLDSRLTYDKDSHRVVLYTRAGEELALTGSIQYYLAQGALSSRELPRDHLSVALTREGMAWVAAHLGVGNAVPELRIYYEAAINENAWLGVGISGQAHLDYVNPEGVVYEAESDAPRVITGGVHLKKTDVEGNPLEAARYRIARGATEADLADPETEVEKLTVDARLLDVVFMEFYPNEELSGAPVTFVDTDEEGNASFCGLAYGTYYIVETKAPAGFNLLSEPVEARINEISHRRDQEQNATILLVSTRTVLPETGGTGTTLFTALGLGLLAFAGAMLLSGHRRGEI